MNRQMVDYQAFAAKFMKEHPDSSFVVFQNNTFLPLKNNKPNAKLRDLLVMAPMHFANASISILNKNVPNQVYVRKDDGVDVATSIEPQWPFFVILPPPAIYLVDGKNGNVQKNQSEKAVELWMSDFNLPVVKMAYCADSAEIYPLQEDS